jgi:CysZ protein
MLKEIAIAVEAYFQAHRFISKHRLWKWILIPGIIYAILFGVGIHYFWISSSFAIDYFLSATGLKHWVQTTPGTGLLSFLLLIGQIFLHMVLMLFYFSFFKYFILIIGSPLFAYLSEKTASILEEKKMPFSFSLLLNDTIRGVKQASRNALWQTVYMFTLLLLAFIPLIGWVTPLIALMTEFYYLGFSMVDYNCARNELSAQQSTAFIGKHKGLAIGNGIVFYFMHIFIIVGWVLAPSYAVVAATLSMYNVKDI